MLDGGALVGMLTRSDLVLGLQRHGAHVAVGDVVRRADESVEASESLESAMQRMRERGRSALPVLHHGAMIGMITLENVGDLLMVRDALQRHLHA